MLPKSSMNKKKFLQIAAPILVLATASYSSAASSVSAIGGAEAIDCRTSSVKILGLSFVADDKATARKICQMSASSEIPYVLATGDLDAAGVVHLTKFSHLSTELYVPGATS